MLPERLRAEVAVHVHLDSLKKIKIFEQCETGFLCELVLKLRSQVFSPGDYVCRVGETGREMFIINHGKVEVIVPNPANNKDMVVAVLTEGNYFGEISLLRLDGVQNRRTADVRSIGYSELLCLSRRDLMAALVEYPEAKSILEAQAKRRMKTNLQAQRAFSVDTLLRSSQDYSSLDSGIAKEENRGHDVSEIKAMIEELKNANKVPGRTVWQLIARCEVLQARLCEKEKEVEDSKRRIRELEQLLVSVHCPKPSRSQEEMPADESDVSSVKHLRPNNKVVKQFSQDEGRHVTRDISDNSANETMNSEQRIVPDVKITRPASEAGSLNTEKNSESVQKYVFKDDNFIKTSKISNVSFEKAQSSKSYQRQSCLSSQDNEFSQKFHISHTQKQSPAVTNSDISEGRQCLERNGNQSEGSFRIFSQNVLNINPSSVYSFSSETMIDHSLMFSNTEQISLTTNFSDEVFLNDPVDLSVHTIPEEPEEDIEDVTEEPSFSNQQHPTSRSSTSNPSSVVKYVGQESVYNNNSVEQRLTRRQDAVNFLSDGLDQEGNNKPSNSLAVETFCSTLDEMTLNAFESGDGINFLKMGCISSCFSDDSNSRRNSWNWESDGDNDEDSDSS
ncbi:Cyclic nucleotide-gated cation channel alpha-3, partial [Stegodyphus mimosarum]